MAPELVPFLMFEGEAGDALDLYVSAFDDAEVVDLDRREDGTIEAAFLRLGEQRIRLFDSPVEHGFGFTPAISLFVEFDEPEEVDAAFAKLSEGGGVLMPLDAYPFSPRFAWINDRFGVSWQLSAKPAT
ncbi:MAG: VOC family protein [Actinobacteria bacterium]|nr:VOC family protein [Actinomycetota bacterium]